MGQPRQTIRRFNLPAGQKLRVWDNPGRDPFRDLYIWINSEGLVTATAIKWAVLYGGGWEGEAFKSNHLGGVSQGNNSIPAGSEVVKMIYADASIFPSNAVKAVPPPQMPYAGFPIVVEIDNSAGIVPLSAAVIFESRETADSQL